MRKDTSSTFRCSMHGSIMKVRGYMEGWNLKFLKKLIVLQTAISGGKGGDVCI